MPEVGQRRLAARAARRDWAGKQRAIRSLPASPRCDNRSRDAASFSVASSAPCWSLAVTTTRWRTSGAPMSRRSRASGAGRSSQLDLSLPECRSIARHVARSGRPRRARPRVSRANAGARPALRRSPRVRGPPLRARGKSRRQQHEEHVARNRHRLKISPAMENSPNCASPGKPDSSMAPKPQMDVSNPNRNVGQMRASVSSGVVPGVICVNR